jgi:hypothetical protein
MPIRTKARTGKLTGPEAATFTCRIDLPNPSLVIAHSKPHPIIAVERMIAAPAREAE